DGLALAVLVRGQVQLARAGQQRLQLGHLGPLVRGDDVERLEPVLGVNAETGPRLALVLGRHVGGTARQVTDVTDGGLDDVAVAEVVRNGPRLVRRLDDDQCDVAGRRPGALTGCHACFVLLYVPAPARPEAAGDCSLLAHSGC